MSAIDSECHKKCFDIVS